MFATTNIVFEVRGLIRQQSESHCLFTRLIERKLPTTNNKVRICFAVSQLNNQSGCVKKREN